MKRRPGMWAALGPGAFATAAVVAARRTPGYVARDQPISSLAAHGSPAAPVMVGGFLGLAVGSLGLARSLRGSPAAPAPVPALLAASAVTIAAAGLARCSDPSCPTRGLDNGDPQPTDDLHAAVSGLTFLLWIATPLVAARRAAGIGPGHRRASAALGAATFGLLIGGGLVARNPEARGGGWAQRAMVASALAWHPLAAWAARRVPDLG